MLINRRIILSQPFTNIFEININNHKIRNVGSEMKMVFLQHQLVDYKHQQIEFY